MDIVNKFNSLTNGMKITVVLVSLFCLMLLYCVFNRKNLLTVQEEKEANLMSENFSSNDEIKFTMYYADWCPHCQAAKPEFKKILKHNNRVIGSKKLKIMLVDCEKNPKKAEKEGVEGYPTFIYQDGDKKEVYEGKREEMGFITYLKEKLGSLF